MKKLAAALAAAGLIAAGGALAQQKAPPPPAAAPATPAAAPAASGADIVRQALRGDRRAAVEKHMQLSPEEAKKFAPIYDAYAKELDKLVQRENRAVLDYVNTESSMSEANAKKLAGEVVAVAEAEAALRQKTFKKVAAALPGKKAGRFVQIENKIRAVQRFDLAEQMPLVK